MKSLTPYIGTKIIEAEPMTRGEYAKLSGRNSILTEKGESADDPGYHVRYPDDYESWSPAKAFEEAYQTFDKMSFGHALELLKRGYAVAREGWNGKGQFVFIASEFEFVTKVNLEAFQESGVNVDKSICMLNAQGDVVVGWLASQTDMLSEDWYMVNLER